MAINYRLGLVYALLCLVYLGCTFTEPFYADFVPKALPILLLLGYALTIFRGTTRWLMLLALGFSATGDVVLNLGLFVPGLAAFLLAQLIYAGIFLPRARWRPERWWAYLAQVLFVLLMCALLLPNLGSMTIPVLAYMAAISLMLLLAISHQTQAPWLALGAAVFVLSDSLIAVNRFIVELPLAGFMIMLTYYLAQWWIFIGIQKASD